MAIHLHFYFSYKNLLSLWLTGSLGMLMIAGLSAQRTRPSSEEVGLEKQLIEGEKYTFLGEWEKAEPIFKQVLEKDVQNSAACYQLSRTMLATGKPDEALSYIRKAIRIEPDNEWYILMEADIFEKKGDFAETKKSYEKLINLRPDKPQYYEMLIGLAKQTKDSETLLHTLDRFEQLVGVSEYITRNRFEALDELGRTDEALAALHQLTVVFPQNTEYKYLAAAYARKSGQEEKAVAYYKDILAINPDDSRARLALASSEKEKGDGVSYLQSIMPIISNPSVDIDAKLEELIPYVVEYSKTKRPELGRALGDVIDNLIASHPKEAKVYAMQGDVRSIGGQDTEAIAAYRQAVQLNDNVYAVWEQLIALQLKNKQYDDLIAEASKAIDVFPNQGYLYYAAGYAYYKKKNNTDALDMLSQALVMTGKNAGQKVNVLNMLGLVHDARNDVDKSTAAFESSLSINAKNPETLSYYALVLSRRITHSDRAIDMADFVSSAGQTPGYIQQILAEVYFNQQQYDKADKAIRLALVENPDGEGYDLAGEIFRKAGHREEAVMMWQKALALNYKTEEMRRKIEENKL